MSEKRERRAYPVQLRSEPGRNILRGYASVFNDPTNLGDFDEIVRPGAFRRSLGVNDIRALWNHNDDVILGRVKAGTLKLREDDRGLAIEIDPPRSAEREVEAIKRGDVDAMSFGFVVRKDRWDERDGRKLRELLDIDLIEVSPVVFPAYEATEISAEARSMVKNWNSDIAKRKRDLATIEASIRASNRKDLARYRTELNALEASLK